MPGEKDLARLLKTMQPKLHEGEFVFCTLKDPSAIDPNEVVLQFKEEEGFTIIVRKEVADNRNLAYSFIAAWITLTVHSSLDGVGFTAAFSKALADEGIGCNVIAAYYHDHIFVSSKNAIHAIEILNRISEH